MPEGIVDSLEEIEVEGETLEAGDAVAIVDQPGLRVQAKRDAEVLLFDMG